MAPHQRTNSSRSIARDDQRRAIELFESSDWLANTTRKDRETSPVESNANRQAIRIADNNSSSQIEGSNNQEDIEVRPTSGSSNETIIAVNNTFDTSERVYRVLKWYHIFAISISGTLGSGLYVQTGAILRLGGPWSLLASMFSLTLLTWGVMQCISEMLCIWPVSGALSVFVERFVDEDLGTSVGIAYWFCNAMGFAAVTAAAADEVAYWSHSGLLRGIFMLFVVPSLLLFINALGVKLYAFIEILGCSLKACFLLVILITMFCTLFGVGKNPNDLSVTEKWKSGHYDSDAASNIGTAFLMCLTMASFAFVGIEIPAATAVEAKAETRSVGNSTSNENSAASVDAVPTTRIKNPATKIPLIVGVVYIIASLALALNVDPTNPGLPQVPWVATRKDATSTTSASSVATSTISMAAAKNTTNSGFVLAAQNTTIKHLPDIFNGFLVITAITASNTALYIASRTLFGLGTGTSRSVSRRWLKIFGKTKESTRVPLHALLASAVFFFVPYFYYLHPTSRALVFLVTSTMSSISCIIVWTCQCLAYIRFFFCIRKHQVELNRTDEFNPPLNRFFVGQPEKKYPWKSFGQGNYAITAYVSLFGCLFILIVANSACLWHGFHLQLFLSAFLAPILFIALVLGIKLYRKNWKFFVPLDLKHAKRIFKDLQDIRDNSIINGAEEVSR